MIKFVLNKERSQLVGLGISKENVKRLKEGKPIHVYLAELGIPGTLEIAIFYGETEEKMQEDISRFIGPDTVVRNNMPKN